MLAHYIPHVNDKEQLYLAIERRRASSKEELRMVQSDVEARYDEFWRKRNSLEALPMSIFDNKKADELRSCYEAKRKVVRELKDAYRQANGNVVLRCAYCQLGKGETIDHFLPKSLYPEFSILSTNLVFVCASCNQKKGDAALGNPRWIINPFFDALDQIEVLKCCFKERKGGVVPLFYIDAGTASSPREEYIVSIAKRHFNFFDLGGEFTVNASGKIREVRDMVISSEEDPTLQDVEAQVKRFVRRRKNSARLETGLNSWEFALWSALEVCSDVSGMVKRHRR